MTKEELQEKLKMLYKEVTMNNKQSMKLYNEKQMKEAIKMARSSYNLFTTPFIYEHDEVLEQLTPIQLPSDEEIEKDVMTNFYPLSGVVGIDHRNYLRKEGFQEGIKYLRNKIQGGNNEQI